jgi:hypothetical protein
MWLTVERLKTAGITTRYYCASRTCTDAKVLTNTKVRCLFDCAAFLLVIEEFTHAFMRRSTMSKCCGRADEESRVAARRSVVDTKGQSPRTRKARRIAARRNTFVRRKK